MPKNLDMNVSDENVALPSDVADGHAYKMAKNGDIVVGTATIYNNTRISIDPGDDYKLPKGFYNDDNIISVKSIADSTSGDAKAEDIAKNKVAWVNGQKIVGTATAFSSNLKKSTATYEDIKQGKMAYDSDGNQIDGGVRVFDYSHYGAITPYPSQPGTLHDGAIKGRDTSILYTPDYIYKGRTTGVFLNDGFYNGCNIVLPYFGNLTVNPEDVVTGKKFFGKRNVPNETDVYEIYEGTGTLDINEKVKEKIKSDGTTITADDMLSTKKGYDKDGNIVTGTIQNVTNTNNVIVGDSNPSYTIPKGYHDGTGKVVYNPATTTQTTATSDDILYGKTALTSDGTLITGTIADGGNMVIDATSVAPYDESHKYFRSLHITDSAHDAILGCTHVPAEMVPNGEIYVDVDGFPKTGTMPIIPSTTTKINGKTNPYTIPKGYHNGTGIIMIRLEKDIRDADKYEHLSSDNVPANVAYFTNYGKCVAGAMRLGTYDPIYTYKEWKFHSVQYNTSFSFSDDPIGHRLISFNSRGQTNFMDDMNSLRGNSVFEFDEESDKVLSQYNKDNLENGYTVLAIPTELHVWGTLKNVPKTFTNSSYESKYFGNVMDVLNSIADDVITEDTRKKTFAKIDPMETNWFSTFLFYNRRKTIVIDDITVDFKGSNIIQNGMNSNRTSIPTFRISFPYIPEEYPTEEYLKKCCDNTRVLFDGIDYNTAEDYGNYKIYGVCTPVRTFAYPYDRSQTSDMYFERLYGGNFAITFHVYNKKKNNYTYERDPEFKDDYVMNQLGFQDPNNNYKLIPIDIRISGIHIPYY